VLNFSNGKVAGHEFRRFAADKGILCGAKSLTELGGFVHHSAAFESRAIFPQQSQGPDNCIQRRKPARQMNRPSVALRRAQGKSQRMA